MKRSTPNSDALDGDMKACLALFVQSLRMARLLAGLSSDEVAKRVGVTRRYLLAVEQERQVPSVKLVQQIARALRDEFEALQKAIRADCLSELQWKAGLPPSPSGRPN